MKDYIAKFRIYKLCEVKTAKILGEVCHVYIQITCQCHCKIYFTCAFILKLNFYLYKQTKCHWRNDVCDYEENYEKHDEFNVTTNWHGAVHAS